MYHSMFLSRYLSTLLQCSHNAAGYVIVRDEVEMSVSSLLMVFAFLLVVTRV